MAIAAAICEYRAAQGITGPLFIGADTHAASAPAQRTALEVLAAYGVDAVAAADDAYTPTPVLSARILRHNRDKAARRADGIVVTPSHNPPEDGGFKYNPPHGGPADTDATRWIEDRANAILRAGARTVARTRDGKARATEDFIGPYVAELADILDLRAICARRACKIGADPLGGSNLACWAPIVEPLRPRHHRREPARSTRRSRFMPVDYDGKIRMDCSSPYAMANLVALKDTLRRSPSATTSTATATGS